ncbi:MAG: hypothetical protein HC843_00870 [Sphingomonadales bacterium]|nr:hypothetical protein [Sphingomonadales bacterium]
MILTLSSSVLAQTPLEEQLVKPMHSNRGISVIDGSDPDATPDEELIPSGPYWKLFNNPETPSKGCSISHFNEDNLVAYLGPTQDSQASIFLVTGPKVPVSKKAKQVKATLSTNGESDQTVNVTHWTLPDFKHGVIIFTLPSIDIALDAMEDEEGVRVSLDGKQIFESAWTKGHAARNKMRKCLTGKL